MGDEQTRQAAQRMRDQQVAGDGTDAQGEIEAILHHVALPVGHGKVDAEGGVTLHQFAQPFDIMQAERGGDADPHRAARLIARGGEILLRPFERVEHGAGVGQQAVGIGRRDQAARGAMEEDGAEMRFHLIQAARDCGMAGVHFLRDAGKAGPLAKTDECSDGEQEV